jgi:hypothetical protein
LDGFVDLSFLPHIPEQLDLYWIPHEWVSTHRSHLKYVEPSLVREIVKTGKLLSEEAPLILSITAVAQDNLALLQLVRYLCTHEQANKEQQRGVSQALPFLIQALREHAAMGKASQAVIQSLFADFQHNRRFLKACERMMQHINGVNGHTSFR